MFSDALPCSARNSHCLLPGLHLQAYNPSTIDINSDAAEMSYWISILQNQIPQVVEKAAASESSTAEAQRRASAFGRALDLHLTRLRCVALLSRLGAFVSAVVLSNFFFVYLPLHCAGTSRVRTGSWILRTCLS
jgi:hypothetical protein